MPLGKDVGANMREITDKHPDWTYKRRLAASLNAARQHGQRIPKTRHKTVSRKRVTRRGRKKKG